MKLTDNQLPAARTSGDMVTLNMGISDNPEDQLMILNVLSSTLYTDKVAAVLREYGCNAYDANVEAGKGTTPIEVGLPNKLEPSLRIRDFGFGMTEEQIANTFVKLGRSTKRDSNEFTGMLGIGSKAGFAYGDSFMVTSFTRGRKTVYNAFRDKGQPRLARMTDGPTKEPDGIEIKVPVRMEHFTEFHEKAERIYRYFKVRPKLSGAKVTYKDTKRVLSGTGWYYTGDGESIAIMGNVGYDLTAEGMGGYSQPDSIRSLLDLGVELEFKIGELEIAASREGLQYKDLTKKAVTARLKTMIGEVGDVFTKQIAQAPTLWEAKAKYADIFERAGSHDVRALRNIVDGQVKWNGTKIDSGRMKIHNEEQDPEVNVFRVWKYSYTSRRGREANPTHCQCGKDTVLVINDLPTKKMSPARERGFFDDPNNAHVTEWIVFTFQSDAAQKRYWKRRELAGAPTINLSSITPAVSQNSNAITSGPRAYNSKHSTKVFVLDEKFKPAGYPVPARSLFWKQESVDLADDKGVYVILDNFFIKSDPPVYGCSIHPENFQNDVKVLRQAGLITGPVYGIKVAVKDKLGTGWVPLKDHVAAVLQAEMSAHGIDQVAADYVAAHNYRPEIAYEIHKDLPKGSKLWNYLEAVRDKREPKQKELLQAILQEADLQPWMPNTKLPKPSINFTQLGQDAIKEYPMLVVLEQYGRQNLNAKQFKNVADYIRLVESV